jgi:hypothetical protein
MLTLKLAPIVTDFNNKQSALSAEISALKSQLASTSIQFTTRMEESTTLARAESSIIMQMLADITANMVRSSPPPPAYIPYPAQLRATEDPITQTWSNMMIDVLKNPSDERAMSAYEQWFGRKVPHLAHEELLNPIYKHRRARRQQHNGTGTNINLGPNDGGHGSSSSGWIALRNIDSSWLQSPAGNSHSAEEYLQSKGLPLQTRFPGFGDWEC